MERMVTRLASNKELNKIVYGVTFDKYRCLIRKGDSVQVMAAIRDPVVSLLRIGDFVLSRPPY